MRDFLDELYRRNVVRAASAYLAFAWLSMEVAHLLDHAMDISGEAQRWLMMFLAIGLIPVFLFSWRYELTAHGLQDEDDLERPKSMHHPVATTLDRITIVMLLLAFLIALTDQFTIEPRSPHAYQPLGMAPAPHDRYGAETP